MEFIDKFINFVNQGGNNVLSAMKVGGFFAIAISAYVEIIKHITIKDVAGAVASLIKGGALIFVLYNGTKFFEFMSKF